MKLIKVDTRRKVSASSQDLSLVKLASKKKFKQLLDFVDDNSSNSHNRMVKRAFSESQQDVVKLFVKMLDVLNINCIIK